MTPRLLVPALGAHAAALAALFGGLWVAGFTPDDLREAGWWVSIWVVNAGILAGNLVMARLASRPSDEALLAAERRREDLHDNHAVVVQQLRALADERDKLDPADYERERAELLQVGSQALRQLESTHDAARTIVSGLATAVPTSPGTAPPTLGPVEALALRLRMERETHPAAFDAALERMGYGTKGMGGEWRGAAWALILVALAALLFSMAGDSSRQRQDGMTMTGGDQTMGNEAPPADPRLAALQQRLDADPNDLEALHQLTRMSLFQQDLPRAMELNKREEALAPDAPATRSHRALLLMMIGRTDQALEILDAVTAEHPGDVDAWVYTGIVARTVDPAKAVAALEKAVALDDRPELRRLLQGAKQAGSAPPAAPTPPPAAPPSGEAEILIAGTIEFEGELPPSDSVFIALKPAGGGPPLAAQKLAPGPFPMPFHVTTADVIPMAAGRPLPGQFLVTVRLDADGNAMTKTPEEPAAELVGVERGTTGMTIRLQ